jgi:hypothetical protein
VAGSSAHSNDIPGSTKRGEYLNGRKRSASQEGLGTLNVLSQYRTLIAVPALEIPLFNLPASTLSLTVQ